MQTISSQVSKNPIPNPNNFLRTPIHLWIYGAPEQETPTQNPFTQRENLLEPWISLQLQKEKEKKGITKQSFWKLNNDGVKGKANLLHTRQQEPQSQQLSKNTNTPLDLWCSSALAAFTPVQPAQSYARWSPWIRQCTANSK